MQVTLNLSKRLGSTGKFSDFCVRFDEHFHFRHKTWTVDPKRFKSLDYGKPFSSPANSQDIPSNGHMTLF